MILAEIGKEGVNLYGEVEYIGHIYGKMTRLDSFCGRFLIVIADRSDRNNAAMWVDQIQKGDE